jgi:hypothetical protein
MAAERPQTQEEFVLPAQSTFALALWVKLIGVVLAPPLAVLFAWGAREMILERAARGQSDDLWLLVIVLAILGGLVLLMLSAPVWMLRTRLTLDQEGFLLRGALRTRRIPWSRIEGYRRVGGRLFAYPMDDRWPMNLSYFSDQGLLQIWLRTHLQNLQIVELHQEDREIAADHSLGLTQEQKEARLAYLRRIVKTINRIAYVAAAAGGANAVFLGHDTVQRVATWVLVPVPMILFLLALRFRDQVRLDYKEGSLYPEGATGILASSIALGLISLLDHHTTLGDRFMQWTVLLTVGTGLLWLHIEWQRIRAQRRPMLVGLHVASIFFLSGFWAGGSLYQINKNADVSEPVWGTTRVTKLYTTQDRTGTSYHAEVAPWRASAVPVELDVSRETYESLSVGAAVDISVRAGALEIPWVDEVKPKKAAYSGWMPFSRMSLPHFA